MTDSSPGGETHAQYRERVSRMRFTYRCSQRMPHAPHPFMLWAGSPSEKEGDCPGVKDDGGCFAFLCHGPGHQSLTRCELRGGHEGQHCTHYGRLGQRGYWSGDEGMTDVWDNAPDD